MDLFPFRSLGAPWLISWFYSEIPLVVFRVLSFHMLRPALACLRKGDKTGSISHAEGSNTKYQPDTGGGPEFVRDAIMRSIIKYSRISFEKKNVISHSNEYLIKS